MTGGSRRGRRLRYAASACGVLAPWSAGRLLLDGRRDDAPLPNTFYFPVGLAVSQSGNVLYVANSDFDLQYNGGTVQSYALTPIRNDAVRLMLGLYVGAAPIALPRRRAPSPPFPSGERVRRRGRAARSTTGAAPRLEHEPERPPDRRAPSTARPPPDRRSVRSARDSTLRTGAIRSSSARSRPTSSSHRRARGCSFRCAAMRR